MYKDSPESKTSQVAIVEASAGSGKTYTLAKRYIALLINPGLKPNEIPLNTILAITFTNKAAIEMKERILDFLKKIALDNFADQKEKTAILDSLGVEPALAKEKAYRIMQELLRNYNFFQVQTIDSFINTILSGCAFKLDLSANFKIKEQNSDYLAFSLDKLIDKVASDKAIAELFRGFLRQYLYIENKTKWFPKQDILALMLSLFSKVNKYTTGFRRNDIEAKDLILYRRKILKLMHELKEAAPEGTDKRFLQSLSEFLKRNKESFDIDYLSDFFKREGFPVKKGCPLSNQTSKLWEKTKKEIRRLCELESACVFNYYIEIFAKMQEDLKIITSQEDVLFLEELNRQARLLFDEKSLELPELYYRLACRFRHFLIDEFQDTSRLQWENLLIMIEEALSTGGTLFFVGDRKQAIYRFRGGDVTLMDEEKERFRNFNLSQQSLDQNYRSQKEIVEFNNTVFSSENLARFLAEKENLKKGAVDFADSDMDEIIRVFRDSRQSCRQDKPGGYVRVLALEAKNKDERDAAVKSELFKLIDSLKPSFALEDIALLARKNEEVEKLSSWLLEREIPVESEKTLDIRQNSYIKEIVSFLKFLNSPIDNLSFASFILGDIFQKAAQIDAPTIQDFIFTAQHEGRKKASYLYREFRRNFPLVWEGLLEEFFKNVGFVPLYELVISIYAKFNVLTNFPDYQGFFMKFLELIKEKEAERPAIASFLEFFDQAMADELYVNITESNAIKILTIHKSKGLEFPVVIIPFLEMNVKVDAQVTQSDKKGLSLMHLKKKYAAFSPGLDGIYRQEYKKSFIDELNSIYVAFTRAKEELYIFVAPRADSGFNLAHLLLPQNNLECGQKTPPKSPKDKERHFSVEIAPARYQDWIKELSDEFIPRSIIEDRELVLRGEILHYILSLIGNLYNQDKTQLVKQAMAQASSRYRLSEDLQDYLALINKLLKQKELEQYFNCADGRIYLEREICDRYGNTKRIDRLIVKAKEVLVVDYKSSKANAVAYHQQVSEYIKILRDIYPALSVKGILIYFDDLSLEVVNG